MKLKKLVYPIGVIFLLATIVTLLSYSNLTLLFAVISLAMFIVEAFFIKEKHADPIGIVIIILIIIILFKIFS
jgi:hypothetical protein